MLSGYLSPDFICGYTLYDYIMLRRSQLQEEDKKGLQKKAPRYQEGLSNIYVSASYLFTASLKALPAENFGSFFAAILIVAPV